MTAAWPTSINTKILFPISKIPRDQRTSFITEAGAPKIGSLATDVIYDVIFDMIFSGTEMVAFWTFWEQDLAGGAEAFTGLSDVVSGAGATYIFTPQTIPQINMIRATRGGDLSISRYRPTFYLIQIA